MEYKAEEAFVFSFHHEVRNCGSGRRTGLQTVGELPFQTTAFRPGLLVATSFVLYIQEAILE